MCNPAIRGLYAVTPDEPDTATLVAQVSAALSGGARFVQYRNKTASPSLRLEQARALKPVCDAHGAALIINDHVALAHAVDAAGVHLGAEDGAVEAARDAIGAGKLIGVSCYNQLDPANAAQASGADYVAFGSFFPSRIKPDAVQAPIDLLLRARRTLSIPVVAIGGITPGNAEVLIANGADALAVITAVFGAADIAAAARAFTILFEARS